MASALGASPWPPTHPPHHHRCTQTVDPCRRRAAPVMVGCIYAEDEGGFYYCYGQKKAKAGKDNNVRSQPRGDSREREESCASAPGSEEARRRRGRGATLPWSRATRGSGIAAEEGGDPLPLHLTIRQEPLWMILSIRVLCIF
ncbi:uncharacterized protein LOC119364120 isoform X2 [Triticum dicoccoides]|uniref:uncharacterized protein LOC119364120 isoform X2 n=1 Tax=Triticum dicoccoides TaxID=85692 RepID=UPI00188E46E7|nr:uncharacterized protein LOC119364120 isoform X2 [Triticum dicoccoides]